MQLGCADRVVVVRDSAISSSLTFSELIIEKELQYLHRTEIRY